MKWVVIISALLLVLAVLMVLDVETRYRQSKKEFEEWRKRRDPKS